MQKLRSVINATIKYESFHFMMMSQNLSKKYFWAKTDQIWPQADGKYVWNVWLMWLSHFPLELNEQ